MHYTQTQHQYAQSPVIASMPSAVSHHHHYSTRPATQTTRVSSQESTFRGSTNPDEDWTKISDLAERRRIQNRIAQRNYRKKLKRRLEDLERRAASRSVSPNGEDTDGRSTRESSTEGPLHSPPPSSEPHLSPPRVPHYSPTYTYSTTSSSYAPTFSSAESTNYYYPPTTLPGIQNGSHYLYSYSQPTLSSVVEATCGSVVPTTSGTEQSSYGLPLPSARISGYAPEQPKTSTYETEVSPFYMSYAGLAETPDPNYFNNYYHHEHATPSTIKQEN